MRTWKKERMRYRERARHVITEIVTWSCVSASSLQEKRQLHFWPKNVKNFEQTTKQAGKLAIKQCTYRQPTERTTPSGACALASARPVWIVYESRCRRGACFAGQQNSSWLCPSHRVRPSVRPSVRPFIHSAVERDLTTEKILGGFGGVALSHCCVLGEVSGGLQALVVRAYTTVWRSLDSRPTGRVRVHHSSSLDLVLEVLIVVEAFGNTWRRIAKLDPGHSCSIEVTATFGIQPVEYFLLIL